MEGKFVLLSGTASRSCSVQQLDLAIRFVQLFVTEVLKAGGGMVVLLGDEKRGQASDSKPRIFDWTVLRAIEEYVDVTTEPVRTYARVVMSDHAWLSKLDDDSRRTLTRLQQRSVLEIERIEREEFTGGEYRKLESELADTMVALGGGKGTYTAGRKMIEISKPVLPLDLEIGALSEDGQGALLLHKELQSDPRQFLPKTGNQAANQLELLSLEGGHGVAEVARRAAEILELELHGDASGKSRGINRLANRMWTTAGRFLTAIGVVRAIDFLKQFFL